MPIISTNLKESLDRVLCKCKGANGHMSPETSDYVDARDIAVIQASMKYWGINLAFGEAYHLWDLVSNDCQQSWCTVDNESDVRIAVEMLCEHVRDGIDYAGFSNFNK